MNNLVAFPHIPRLIKSILLCFALLPLLGHSADITIAVASNFTQPMRALTDKFNKLHTFAVKPVYGSSGTFVSQITHGAPFQALFAADQLSVSSLMDSGLAVADSRFTYAIGSLVLWSSDSTLIDTNASALKLGKFKKLALANPKLAPYGLAAKQTLTSLNLFNSNLNKLVEGQNIAQTYQFVYTGNAELGFVSASQVYYDGKLLSGSAWPVPTDLHEPIVQDAVILTSASVESRLTLKAFFQFVQTSEAKQLIARFGYTTPP